MGRLEKIVVLTVLFLVAVILAISLNQSGDKKAPGGPLGSSETKKNETVATPGAAGAQNGGAQPNGGASAPNAAGAVDPKAPTEVNPGLINTSIKPDASPSTPGTSTPPPLNKPSDVAGKSAGSNLIAAPQASASGSGLKTRDGLTESLFNDLFLYTWQTGDTFASLATRYYGSDKQAVRLHTANEGRAETSLKPGDKIFVPNVEASTPAASTKSGAIADPNAPVESKKNSTDDGYYTVQKGDVLGTIAKKVYGSTKKWQKIYDANRDLLKDPNALKVGMKLRIPE